MGYFIIMHVAINLFKHHQRKESQLLKIKHQSWKLAIGDCTHGSSSPVQMGYFKSESTVRMGHAIPWICYERNFNEFYLSIWNQLISDQRIWLFVQSPQPYLLIFAWRNWMCFPNILVKKNEYLNSAEQIPRNWNVDQVSVLITSWDIT